MSLREVIDDIVRVTPAISAEEIGKVVAKEIESVLPNAIRNVKLPRTPSPIYLRKKEYEVGRTKKGSREFIQERLTERDTFISELASLQFALDGTASTVALHLEPGAISNAPVLSVQNPFEIAQDYRKEEVTTPESAESSRRPRIEVDLPLRRQPNIHKNLETNTILDAVPSGLPLEETDKLLRIPISTELQARLSSEENIAHFVATVETAVRKFALGWKLTWGFDFDLRTDLEEPEWTKMVLRLHPLGMDFEDSMKIWERIDSAVRTALGSEKKRMEGSGLKAIDDLNRNFFVELDLN